MQGKVHKNIADRQCVTRLTRVVECLGIARHGRWRLFVLGENMKKILAIVLVLVVAVAALVPYMTGAEVESQFRAAIADINQTGDIKATIKSYERGWLGSQAQLDVVYNEFEVRFENKINHPLIPGVSQTHIVSSAPRDQSPDLLNLFGETPLRIDSWITDDETFRIEARSPVAEGTVKLEDGRQVYVKWGGLYGVYETDDAVETYEITIPSALISGAFGEASLRDARTVGSARLNTNFEQPMLRSLLGSGSDELSIAQISFNGADGRAGSVAVNINSIVTFDDDRGSWHVDVDLSDIEVENPYISEEEKIDLVAASAHLKMDGLRLDALARVASSFEASGDATWEELSVAEQKSFIEDLIAAFDTESQVELDVPAIQTEQGDVGMGVTVTLGEPLSKRARQYMTPAQRVAQRLQLSAAGFVDEGLLDSIVETGPSPYQARLTINEWVNANLVSVNNGRYSLVADYEDNSLAFNGRTLPPSAARQIMVMLLGSGA